jgi:hypothetical protein
VGGAFEEVRFLGVRLFGLNPSLTNTHTPLPLPFALAQVICNGFAAVAYLVSTIYSEQFGSTIGLTAQYMLFGFSALFSLVLFACSRPLLHTSNMVAERFLQFLTDHQIFLQSQMAEALNDDVLGDDQRKKWDAQISELTARQTKLIHMRQPIKILGLAVTRATVGRFLGMVVASLISGLLRQATNDDQLNL